MKALALQAALLFPLLAFLPGRARAASPEANQQSAALPAGDVAWTPLPQFLFQGEKREHLAHFNLGKNSLAIQGYDPVAYFKEGGGKPQAGKQELSYTHLQVSYRFATQAHLDLFKKNPAKYEPLYGGWCAYAMADNDKTDINPKSFLIQDGKLLLFYDGFWGDTRKLWSKDPKGYSPKAAAGWKKFTAKKK